MRIKALESVLLVVDLQERLLPAINGGSTVLAEATWLVGVANKIGIPIITTEHCPDRVGLTSQNLRSQLPVNGIVEKTYFSALAENTLLEIPGASLQHWVVIGTEAHVCVQQTVLDLLSIGRQVFVVEEAVGSRKLRDKHLALERMRQNGAEIVSREMVAFEWLASADNPLFREILRQYIR